jgi:cytochrome c oxidase cbb3-type subunit I
MKLVSVFSVFCNKKLTIEDKAMPQENAYDYRAVKGFAISSLFWGVVGLLIGILISLQLVYPQLNFTSWLTYGRLRPLHTNALIYGFTVPAAFSLFFYLVQRLGRAPLAFPGLAQATLYVFNIAIVLAALSLFAGMNTSKEYSELEWPLDIGVVILWVMFSINIIGTIIKRKEEQMYVSLWFILATVVGVAIVYIGNNLGVPVSWSKSYSIYAGANDANVQWWFGHNAVAFVFTTLPLAVFYYILPKPSSGSGHLFLRTSGPEHITWSTRLSLTGSRPLPSLSASSLSRPRGLR